MLQYSKNRLNPAKNGLSLVTAVKNDPKIILNFPKIHSGWANNAYELGTPITTSGFQPTKTHKIQIPGGRRCSKI